MNRRGQLNLLNLFDGFHEDIMELISMVETKPTCYRKALPKDSEMKEEKHRTALGYGAVSSFQSK